MEATNKPNEFFEQEKLKQGFNLPPHYFDELPYQIHAQRVAKQTKQTYWIWTSSVIGLCSIVLLFFFTGQKENWSNYYIENHFDSSTQEEYLQNELTEEEVIEFYISSDEDFN